MNADRLLAQFERVADAPDAIPRLRRLVLDLAVRGKLVEQDSNDEPAEELLKRIAAEKERLFEEREVQEPKNTLRIERNALPFDIPTRWRCVPLFDIAKNSYAIAFPSGQFNLVKRGIPLIRIRDIISTDTDGYFEGEFY
ncbi:MAG: hypothetical protein J4F48_10980, partial [Nitrospinae bacterium]|nr:hypothetical protein [Nitrospinota bacterium]